MDAINGINQINPRILGDENIRKAKAGYSETVYGLFDDENKGVNGQIDEEVFQGQKGDCWLISGILSLSYDDKGKELIQDAIGQNPDGSYSVYFKGIDKEYTVTKEELERNNKSTLMNGLGITNSSYSTGDDDMLLIELALEKLVSEGEVPIETLDGITGGSAYYLYELFTDNMTGYAYGDDEEEMANLLNYYNQYQDDCSAVLGVDEGFGSLEDDHAYAVKEINRQYMTLVNPWDTTKEINVSIKELKDNFGSYDFSLADNELKEESNWLEENYA